MGSGRFAGGDLVRPATRLAAAEARRLEYVGWGRVARAMNRLLPILLLCVACHTTAPGTDAQGAGGELQVQVVKLEHAQANDVVKVLEETLANPSVRGGGFRVVRDADHNALVLSGTTEQIREALDVVAKLDSRSGR